MKDTSLRTNKAFKAGCLFLVSWFLLFAQVNNKAQASFQKALEIYSNGDFEQAKQAFETMALIGDSSSLFNLAVMYFRGESVDKDVVKAYAMMRIANDGIDDEHFSKIMALVRSKLDEAQLRDSEAVYDQLLRKYGFENIQANILPKLLDDKDCPPEAEPIVKTKPRYPSSEARNGRMGIVHAEYTISPLGYPRDIFVSSSTSAAFTIATIDALRHNRFSPPPNGVPDRRRQTTIFIIGRGNVSKKRTDELARQLNELQTEASEGNVVSQYHYARTLNTYRHFKRYFKGRDFQYREANEWFTKAAVGGVANAQFEIGRNMFEGRGCEVDKKNGFKWIQAAAVGGHSPAQQYLASATISDDVQVGSKPKAVESWLRNAAQDEINGFPAKVLLAWELVASAEKSIHNPREALGLLTDVPVTYRDKIRILETEAAANALLGKYKRAVRLQKKALKIAKGRKMEIPRISERLALYENEQVYVGSYF